VRKLAAIVMTSATLFFGFAGPAAAQPQIGLVNVNIGDVTILEDVNVAVAANIVAAVCVQPNLNLAAAVLAVQRVDQEATGPFTCEARGGSPDFTITQDA
jgi:hypothetical protein